MVGSSSSAADAGAATDSVGLRQRKPGEAAAVTSAGAASSADTDGQNNGGGGDAGAAAGAAKKIDGPAAVDYHFKVSSAITIVWFVALCAIMYLVVPSERIERLEGVERTAATLAAATLAVSCLSTVHRSFSGCIAAALVVQLCAVVTDVLMATAPVPVMIDAVTGARVHMLRWCEFAPLAFLMTLLTEGGDMATNPEGGIRDGYILAVTQGASTSFGLLFPFLPGVKSWVFCLGCAISLFLPIFFRLAGKMRTVRSMDPKAKHYRRSVLCLRLLIVEAIVWTLLVVGYLGANVLPAFIPAVPGITNPAVTMIYDCAMDVIAKVIYMALIVNVHDAMFAKVAAGGGRPGRGGGDALTLEERRMKELRRQMRKQKRAEKERREAEKAKQAGTATAGAGAGAAEGRKDQ